jgi:hypothetical protein
MTPHACLRLRFDTIHNPNINSIPLVFYDRHVAAVSYSMIATTCSSDPRNPGFARQANGRMSHALYQLGLTFRLLVVRFRMKQRV